MQVRVLAGAVCLAAAALTGSVFAQNPAANNSASSPDQSSRPTKSLRSTEPIITQDIATIDAQRGAFDRFLDSHPEIAREVIGHPESARDVNYLRDHPELEAFLESRPIVKADPVAFVSPRYWRPDPQPSSGLNNFLSDFPPVLAFACFLTAAIWIVRILTENRRWNRSFKMHEELQTKLIEKFASGQDFSAYIQSEGGRRLLEWSPPVAEPASQKLPNPIGRIFWSVQAGLLLLLTGVGMLLLRRHVAASELLVFGTLCTTLGAGFILSAAASYALSKHLDLIKSSGPAGSGV